MFPRIAGVTFEENAERLKIWYPLKRQWIFFIVLSIMMVFWLIMVVGTIVFAIRDVVFSGERFAFVFTIMLLIFLLLLYFLGRLVWRQWQFFSANREILFINKEILIIRRPISVLGITDAYDMQFVRPFFFNEDTKSPAFEYGSRTVFFGQNLARPDAERLMEYVNVRFFPDAFDEDED